MSKNLPIEQQIYLLLECHGIGDTNQRQCVCTDKLHHMTGVMLRIIDSANADMLRAQAKGLKKRADCLEADTYGIDPLLSCPHLWHCGTYPCEGTNHE